MQMEKGPNQPLC